MKEYKNVMLVSPKKVKESGSLNLNVDEGAIGAAIRTAQGVYLQDVVGADLIEALQEKVYNKIQGESANTIDSEENVAYKTLLDEYVTPALISKTVIEVAIRISLKIRNMGVVQNSDMNVNSATLDDIKYLQNYEETMWNHYLNRLAEFLCANKDAIPESTFNCDCEPERKFANVNLYLGN